MTGAVDCLFTLAMVVLAHEISEIIVCRAHGPRKMRRVDGELVRYSIEDILSQPDEALQSAIRYVQDKNADLYQRLA